MTPQVRTGTRQCSSSKKPALKRKFGSDSRPASRKAGAPYSSGASHGQCQSAGIFSLFSLPARSARCGIYVITAPPPFPIVHVRSERAFRPRINGARGKKAPQTAPRRMPPFSAGGFLFDSNPKRIIFHQSSGTKSANGSLHPANGSTRHESDVTDSRLHSPFATGRFGKR